MSEFTDRVASYFLTCLDYTLSLSLISHNPVRAMVEKWLVEKCSEMEDTLLFLFSLFPIDVLTFLC